MSYLDDETLMTKIGDGEVGIELLAGPEGPCLVIMNQDGVGTRVAGPKPWGGGKIIHSFTVPAKAIRQILDGARK